MKGKILELKQWLKDSGKEIRRMKDLHKNYQRMGYESAPWNSKRTQDYSKNLGSLCKLRWEYRHKHIAYSELRGRTRAQIEASYPYEGRNGWHEKPDESWIKRIKKEYLSACSQTAEGGGL